MSSSDRLQEHGRAAPARVYIGLGSNQGQSREILRSAMEDLRERLEDFACSGMYRTEPLYVSGQPDFLNSAVTGLTGETPEELLATLQALEERYGRNRDRERRFGPRSLDLDILLFGSRTQPEPSLTLPHPRLLERRFVLEPLLELDPALRDPRDGRSLKAYLRDLQDQRVQREEGCPCENCDEVPAYAAGG